MDISTRAARRRARRLALGAVLATGALATSASAALAAPTTTVTPHANLDPDATTTVTVRGSDFTAANGISPLGIYVAQTAIVDGQVVANAARARWVQSRGPTSNETLNPDGTFETTVEVSRTLTVGDTTVDCRVTPCAISTWRAHSLPTVDALYTSTLITFGPPAVEVSPTTGLDRNGPTTVTVKGRQFTTGTYVAVTAIVNGQVLADAARTRWVRANGPTPADTLNPDGTFQTTLEVHPTFTVGETTVDCRVTQCAISTWRQHTNPTPGTLFTTTPIAFAEAPTIVDPPTEEPVVKKPKIGRVSAAQRIGRSRTATVAILTCGSARCQISVPKAVRVKIGRARYRVRVLAPKTARAGQRVRVRVQLTKAAARALKHRRAKVRVRVAITANGTRTAKTVTATITGVRKAAKR